MGNREYYFDFQSEALGLIRNEYEITSYQPPPTPP